MLTSSKRYGRNSGLTVASRFYHYCYTASAEVQDDEVQRERSKSGGTLARQGKQGGVGQKGMQRGAARGANGLGIM